MSFFPGKSYDNTMLLFINTSYLKIYYWACAAILWTYMFVTITNLYKSWYITTACVLILTVLLLMAGGFKTRGLIRSTSYILIYYLYLLLTAIWAEYAGITIWYVATESIYIIIFSLFYLLSLNFGPDRIIDFFVYLVPPSIIIVLMTYIIDPEASRLGNNVLVLLPFIFLFCAFRLIQLLHIRYVVFVTACLLMLVIGMSRTPLLIAGLGLSIMLVMIRKRWRALCKIGAAFFIIGVIVTITVIVVPQLRLYAANTIMRTTYKDVVVGDQVIEAEMPDVVRWKIFFDAFSLYKSHWLFGMGYMNFMPWYGDMYDFRFENIRGKETVGMSLHNTFQTWALEGGLPCLGIVGLLLWKYFSILRKQIRQSKNYMEKLYYKLFVIGMACLIISGMFHQIHQAPVFFILLGIVYAFDNKYRDSTVQTFTGIGR